jgi:hypothetical protein
MYLTLKYKLLVVPSAFVPPYQAASRTSRLLYLLALTSPKNYLANVREVFKSRCLDEEVSHVSTSNRARLGVRENRMDEIVPS